jgi:hypothetical protein
MEYYEDIPPFTMIPPELQDLLLEEGRECSDGGLALGTGTILSTASSRGGKTTKMYGLIDWVVAHTKRKVILNNFPEIIIKKGIPPHWRGRVVSGDINELWRIDSDTNAVWLIDDSAVHNSSAEAYNSSTSKYLSKISGIISHLGGGQTLLYTTQNLAGVQKSLFRFTETVLMVGHMNISGLRTERNEFFEDISNAQYLLHQAHEYAGSNDKRYRDFYITVTTNNNNPYRIIPFVKPRWLFDLDPKRKDMLSRPFRYMDVEEIQKRIFGESKSKKGVKNEKTV